MNRKIGCEFCFLINDIADAIFVLVTGDIDSQEVKEWFICMRHADWLCGQRNDNSRKRIFLEGVMIDSWQINIITDKAREFYVQCLLDSSRNR